MTRGREPLGLIQSWPGEVLGADQPVQPWLVAHVRPRQEKLLANAMRRRALPGALFLRQHVRIYPGKGRQVSLMPLIPGYLFMVDAPEAREALYDSGRIVRLLTAPRPEELHRDLLDLAALLAGAPEQVEVRPEIVPGLRVVLQYGSMAGCAGVVVRRQGIYEVVVNVHLLGTAVAVRCNARDVEAAVELSA
jgi:hypothetical protein